jgi:hypothetical protein
MKKASLSQALKGLDRRAAAGPVKPAPSPRVSVTASTRAGKRSVTFYASRECLKQLKMTAADQERPQEQCLTEALNDWFAKYGKAQLA